ncbi:mechanosensitive ion channel family protein [Flagellimonas sp. SN16]|uniref:mechanosensitive ion channel family protein n=1 Tax=Flagellimonas sp. SN16 TaxID=3415142 RepID=UPI003C4CCC8A
MFKSLRSIAIFLGMALVVDLIDIVLKVYAPPDWFHKVVISLNVFVLTYVFTEFLIFIYDRYTKAKQGKATSLYHILIRILSYIAGFVIFTHLIGFELAPVLTALGVGGLAVALALQDTLGNLFAGLHILAAKQLQPGDYIKLDSGEEGYVLDINWRNTVIKTLLENVVIIPNSKISSTITTNFFTLQKNLFFQVVVGVHYDSDLKFVETVTLEVAEELLSEYPPLPKRFEPIVRFYEFADSSINMKVWLATDLYENQFKMRHQFIQRLQKRFKEEGIVIPFPIRTIEISKDSILNLRQKDPSSAENKIIHTKTV